MINTKFGLCAIVFAIVCGAVLLTSATPWGGSGDRLIGSSKCTWGPSYWCSNLTNAKGCHAVSHCIQTVWEKRDVPVDTNSVCQICKEMVTEARDQLRSNETMEELKEVLEGSCNLIPIKPVKKECCRLADDFIPELVEALSSQMNPDQVCSVAGLCNNVEIDKMLEAYYSAALDGSLTEEPTAQPTAKPDTTATAAAIDVAVAKPNKLSCGNCNALSNFLVEKYNSANRDKILENMLYLCGEMSSFSDACANIVISYFTQIDEYLATNLRAEGVCHVSGTCSSRYHQHGENTEELESVIDMKTADDNIPCELCEQLVQHLRDVLVANTTETEFKQVLEGLCKQTKGFKDECLSIVDQYYAVIYDTLVNNLDPNGACFLVGVCPKTLGTRFQGAISPLVRPIEPVAIKVSVRKLGANEPKFTESELQQMVLPIDHLMGAANPGLLVENGNLCTLCEYMLHFIQDELATPATEEEIKRSVNNICNKLPISIRGECHNFIDMYSDAVIALLIQGLDPRAVCPKMQMCPHNNGNREDMEVFAPKPIDNTDKPTCPLCLFAVEQAQAKIKDKKSKNNIKYVLDHLCSHLPIKLQAECVDFVHTYSGELIDMLITDFKPQEICVALKLCTNNNNYLRDLGISVEDDEHRSTESDSASNEIDHSSEVQIVSIPGGCVLCEQVITMAEKKMGHKPSKADIKAELKAACSDIPQNMRQKCYQYVEMYGDKVASLVIMELEPKMICREIGLCFWSDLEDLEIDEALKYDVIAMPNEKANIIKEPPSCVLCEFVMTKLEADLKNKTTKDEIKHTIENICQHMPKTVSKSCTSFVEQYAYAILDLIGEVPPKQICQKLQLCDPGLDRIISDDVIECGVCHGASMVLLPYLRENTDHSNIATYNMVSVACENLPAKYYEICSEMVSIYGQSIMHLSKKPETEESHVCAEIGKCFDNEKSSLAFANISA